MRQPPLLKTECLHQLTRSRCLHLQTIQRPQSFLPALSSTHDIRLEEMKLTLKMCISSHRWNSKNYTVFDSQTRNSEFSSFRAYTALSNLGILKFDRCART